MKLRKILTVCVATACFILGSMTALASSKAEGLVNLETHEKINADAVWPGHVIQFNVGNAAGNCGYRFYLDRQYVGNSGMIVKSQTLVQDEAVSVPGLAEVYDAHIWWDDYKKLEPAVWRFERFSSDGYAEYYCCWGDDYTRAEYKKDHEKDQNHTDDDNHIFGQWYVTTDSDCNNYGTMKHWCMYKKCQKEEAAPVSVSVFVSDVARQVKFARSNATIAVGHPDCKDVSSNLVNVLSTRPDVTVLQTYKVDGKKYQRRISAAGVVELGCIDSQVSTPAASGQSDDGFDAAFYASKYPDVVAELGNDPVALKQHYDMFGKKEGRKAHK